MTNDAATIGIQQTGSSEGLQIAQLLGKRDVQRQSWHQQFGANYTALADAVSNSIASEVVKKLGEQLKDPYKALPTSSNPLVSVFSLEMGRSEKVSRLQSLAKETAELEPFKEWFAKFGPQENPVAKVYEVSKFSSSVYVSSAPEFEFEFFQSEMAKVCERIESVVKKQLSALKANPENKALSFEVERYEKGGNLFSKGPADSIRVKTWLETKK